MEDNNELSSSDDDDYCRIVSNPQFRRKLKRPVKPQTGPDAVKKARNDFNELDSDFDQNDDLEDLVEDYRHNKSSNQEENNNTTRKNVITLVRNEGASTSNTNVPEPRTEFKVPNPVAPAKFLPVIKNSNTTNGQRKASPTRQTKVIFHANNAGANFCESSTSNSSQSTSSATVTRNNSESTTLQATNSKSGMHIHRKSNGKAMSQVKVMGEKLSKSVKNLTIGFVKMFTKNAEDIDILNDNDDMLTASGRFEVENKLKKRKNANGKPALELHMTIFTTIFSSILSESTIKHGDLAQKSDERKINIGSNKSEKINGEQNNKKDNINERVRYIDPNQPSTSRNYDPSCYLAVPSTSKCNITHLNQNAGPSSEIRENGVDVNSSNGTEIAVEETDSVTVEDLAMSGCNNDLVHAEQQQAFRQIKIAFGAWIKQCINNVSTKNTSQEKAIMHDKVLRALSEKLRTFYNNCYDILQNKKIQIIVPLSEDPSSDKFIPIITLSANNRIHQLALDDSDTNSEAPAVKTEDCAASSNMDVADAGPFNFMHNEARNVSNGSFSDSDEDSLTSGSLDCDHESIDSQDTWNEIRGKLRKEIAERRGIEDPSKSKQNDNIEYDSDVSSLSDYTEERNISDVNNDEVISNHLNEDIAINRDDDDNESKSPQNTENNQIQSVIVNDEEFKDEILTTASGDSEDDDNEHNENSRRKNSVSMEVSPEIFENTPSSFDHETNRPQLHPSQVIHGQYDTVSNDSDVSMNTNENRNGVIVNNTQNQRCSIDNHVCMDINVCEVFLANMFGLLLDREVPNAQIHPRDLLLHAPNNLRVIPNIEIPRTTTQSPTQSTIAHTQEICSSNAPYSRVHYQDHNSIIPLHTPVPPPFCSCEHINSERQPIYSSGPYNSERQPNYSIANNNSETQQSIYSFANNNSETQPTNGLTATALSPNVQPEILNSANVQSDHSYHSINAQPEILNSANEQPDHSYHSNDVHSNASTNFNDGSEWALSDSDSNHSTSIEMNDDETEPTPERETPVTEFIRRMTENLRARQAAFQQSTMRDSHRNLWLRQQHQSETMRRHSVQRAPTPATHPVTGLIALARRGEEHSVPTPPMTRLEQIRFRDQYTPTTIETPNTIPSYLNSALYTNTHSRMIDPDIIMPPLETDEGRRYYGSLNLFNEWNIGRRRGSFNDILQELSAEAAESPPTYSIPYVMPLQELVDNTTVVFQFDGTTQGERCNICLNDYIVNETLRRLTCFHTFHRICIDRWLTRERRTCPICRTFIGSCLSFPN